MSVNRLYYSDDYGVYKIDLEDLVGESQFVTERFLTTDTSPSIPSNKVTFIHGTFIGSYNFLTLSIGEGDGYGVKILRDETNINPYADGYYCRRGHLTDNGILYLINKDRNKIEVYYGAYFRSGVGREPDFVYDGYSTPALFSNNGNIGEILSLHVVSGDSSVLDGGSKIYVGQSIGMTIIDAFDQYDEGIDVLPGTSAGQDDQGISKTFGISTSNAEYKSIGGTISRVTDITADEDNYAILVVTSDGAGNGGITQINSISNSKIVFMTEETELIPSDDVRKISKNL